MIKFKKSNISDDFTQTVKFFFNTDDDILSNVGNINGVNTYTILLMADENIIDEINDGGSDISYELFKKFFHIRLNEILNPILAKAKSFTGGIDEFIEYLQDYSSEINTNTEYSSKYSYYNVFWITLFDYRKWEKSSGNTNIYNNMNHTIKNKIREAFGNLHPMTDEMAASKIKEKIMGTPNLTMPVIKQYVTKYLGMVGKNPSDVDFLAALVWEKMQNGGYEYLPQNARMGESIAVDIGALDDSSNQEKIKKLVDKKMDIQLTDKDVQESFESKAQQKKCYAMKSRGEAGSWDCDEWSEKTNFNKIPNKKITKEGNRSVNKFPTPPGETAIPNQLESVILKKKNIKEAFQNNKLKKEKLIKIIAEKSNPKPKMTKKDLIEYILNNYIVKK